MNIGIFGTGYVGSVTGTVLADKGNKVICTDIDKKRIQQFNDLKKIPMYEPGLEGVIRKNVSAGRLNFSDDFANCVVSSDVLFTCVGTPPKEDGSADLSAVFDVARDAAKIMLDKSLDYRLFVIKSTVPPLTSDAVYECLSKILPANRFDVAMNPEFLAEGNALKDAILPDRVVIGVSSARAEKVLRELYAPFLRSGNPLRVVSLREAEIVKYGANGMLATKVSFYNELANLCDALGANVRRVIEAITDDVRIGKKFCHPSHGYGGSCFPKDVKALIHVGNSIGVDLSVLKSVDSTNMIQKTRLFDKMQLYFGDLRAKHFAMWGLAFKKETDDAREAPAVDLADKLLRQGASICAYDPQAMDFARNKTILRNRVSYSNNEYSALKNADGLIVCTEWDQFGAPDFDRIAAELKNKVIFDGKSLYDPVAMTQKGFAYFGIGVENDIARSYRKSSK